MIDDACFIDGKWRPGLGPNLESHNPADGSTTWSGSEATAVDVTMAIDAARAAQPVWEALRFLMRRSILERFAASVQEERDHLAALISAETGKPRWEALTEVDSVVGKVRLSVDAYNDRTPTAQVAETASITHRALGVMGVLGPFNFPAHLPNGQIVPALLAGNTVVYKPSEQAPSVAAAHARLLAEAGLPPGVLNLVIGGRDAGAALVDGPVDGIAFTGAASTGLAIHCRLAGRPEVLLALEMGGNNPLVVADHDDIESAVNLIIRSAFITAGQRCTCARRLYLPRSPAGDETLDALVETTARLRIGAPEDEPEPFAGPVISEAAAANVRAHVDELSAAGATVLTGPGEPVPGTGFVRPSILLVDGVDLPDEEIFGPVLSVQRYDKLDDAFVSAADTDYGLVAGLIGGKRSDFTRFGNILRAGLVNWNTPTTGASGRLAFGGVGLSGNYRPAGWNAADFCAYPVATLSHARPSDAASPLPGLNDR